MCIVNIIYFSS